MCYLKKKINYFYTVPAFREFVVARRVFYQCSATCSSRLRVCGTNKPIPDVPMEGSTVGGILPSRRSFKVRVT